MSSAISERSEALSSLVATTPDPILADRAGHPVYGMFAKVPVFDPASPKEAQQMLPIAFELSEKYQIPSSSVPS